VKTPILVLLWLLFPSSLVFTSSAKASAQESDGTLTEILDCSTIRIAEQFYILENIDRGPKNQKFVPGLSSESNTSFI
jgi:hypothetical protein